MAQRLPISINIDKRDYEPISLGFKKTANICGLSFHGLQNAHHSKPPNAPFELQNG